MGLGSFLQIWSSRMMAEEYRRATGIVGSLGLVLIGANGVLLLAGTSDSANHRGQSEWRAGFYHQTSRYTGLLIL